MDEQEYQTYTDLFSSAEARLKEVEQLTSDLVIPSVNQLRYAGYHCSKSLKKDIIPSEKSKHLRKAEDHCKRAIYDSVEVGILFLLEKIELFKKDYRFITIGNIIEKYTEKLKQINEIRRFFATFNSHDNIEILGQAQQHFKSLLLIAENMDIAREELNKKVRNYMITIALTFGGVIIALLKLILR